MLLVTRSDLYQFRKSRNNFESYITMENRNTEAWNTRIIYFSFNNSVNYYYYETALLRSTFRFRFPQRARDTTRGAFNPILNITLRISNILLASDNYPETRSCIDSVKRADISRCNVP